MAASLPPYLRPPEEWTAEQVTARDIVPYRDIAPMLWCEGCRITREVNVWRIGARLADDHLQELRFAVEHVASTPPGLKSRAVTARPGRKS